ncbi:MAG: pilin [Candidatus Saccharimonadales bacterium]
MAVFGALAVQVFWAVTANCGVQTNRTVLQCETGLPQVAAGNSQIQQILKIVFAVLAALSVLMIVIAGFRYTIAQGNPQEVSKARNTIVYSLIGLVVALAAEVIVAFVLGKV